MALLRRMSWTRLGHGASDETTRVRGERCKDMLATGREWGLDIKSGVDGESLW